MVTTYVPGAEYSWTQLDTLLLCSVDVPSPQLTRKPLVCEQLKPYVSPSSALGVTSMAMSYAE